MTKAAEMAKVSVKGGFHLLWGLVASTVISAVGTIYLANLLSPDELGLYALAIAAPNLIGVFRDWGVNAALIRYAAQYNSEKQITRAKKILISGLMFEVVAGVVLTIVSFLLSALFANIYHFEAITPLIQIASFTILISAFLTVAQSAFTGLERMELNSVTMIAQSIIKAILIPVFVILGLGVFGAVLGYTISFLIAGVTGALLMWLLYKQLPSSTHLQIQKQEPDKKEKISHVKTLLKYGLPISISTIIAAFQTQFYTILLGVYATTDAVGNYALAATFVVLITFFAAPITTMLFPAFSKLDPQKDHESLRSVFQFSVKYAALLVVPVATIVMTLSQPAVHTLFGNKYDSAPLFLTLLAITYLFTAFGNLSAGNFINGQGKTAFNLKLSLLAAGIGFPLSIILASQLGVTGIIITSLTTGIPSLIISLSWIKKHYGLTIDWGSSGKILLSSAFAGAITFLLQSWLTFASWITLTIGVATFVLVFLPTILLTRAIAQVDIDNLRQMTASLGAVNLILNPTLNFIEKLNTLINRPTSKQPSSLPAQKPLK